MARGSVYPVITVEELDGEDLILGTDIEGSGKVTKNFTVDLLKAFINQGTDFSTTLYPTFVASSNEDGTEVESSTIKVIKNDITAATTYNTFGNSVTWDVRPSSYSDTGWELRIRDYRGNIHLPSLVGSTIDINRDSTDGDDDKLAADTPRFIVDSIIVDPLNDDTRYFTDDTGWYVAFAITRSDNLTPSPWDNIQNTRTLVKITVNPESSSTEFFQTVNVDIGGNIDLSNINISGNTGTLDNDGTITSPDFTVAGVTEMNELKVETRIVIGDDEDGQEPPHFVVHGNIQMDGPGDAITFGQYSESPTDEVFLQNDAGHLTIGGTGDVTVSNDLFEIQNATTVGGNFSQRGTNATFSIQPEFITTAGGNTINVVEGNTSPANITDAGQLQSLVIGNQRFTVATSGSTAQLLPGISQEILGPFDVRAASEDNGSWPTDVTELFVATLEGYELEFVRREDLDNSPTNTANADAGTISLSGGTNYFDKSGDNKTRFDTIWNALSNGERLFVADPRTGLSNYTQGDDVTANKTTQVIYEIYNYSTSTGRGYLASVADGDVYIAGDELVFESVPSDGGLPESHEQFLILNTDNQKVRAVDIDITPVSTGIEYGDSNVGIDAITFEGPDHFFDTTTDQNHPVIRLTNPFGISEQSSSFTAEAHTLYVLAIVASAQVMTLPTGSNGDIIKVKCFDANSRWTISPGGTQMIEGDTSLVINEAHGFELIYSGETYGWVVV